MSNTNNTTKVKKKQYHHLTIEQRAQIEILLNAKDKNGKRLFSNNYIADAIGVNKSTISRELRNRIKSKINVISGKITNKPYNAIDAQNDYNFKKGLSKAEYKLEKYPKMAKFIEEKIKVDKWAPDVIIGYMKTHNMFKQTGFCEITTPTIYNAIRYGIISVKISDTRRMKYDPKYEYKEKNQVSKYKLDYSIGKSPEEINKL